MLIYVKLSGQLTSTNIELIENKVCKKENWLELQMKIFALPIVYVVSNRTTYTVYSICEWMWT